MLRLSDFSRNFLAPQLGILAVTLVALFGLFFATVREQNVVAKDREVAQIETGLASRVNFVARNLRDYSRWNDSVDNLARTLNVDWANKNIGPYLFDVQGYEHTFVIEPDGNTLYASDGPRQTSRTARDVLGVEVDSLLARLNASPNGTEDRFARLTALREGPAIVAASAILPNLTSEATKSFSRRYILIVKRVDAQMLASIAADYRTSKLSLTTVGETDRGKASVNLTGGRGQTISRLEWVPARPGDIAQSRYLPWLVGIALIAIGLAIFVLKRAQSATGDLAASEASARHLANHDTLTGLPNRRALRVRGLRLATIAKAIIYLDLDGFKEVNDLFGHQAGDELLKEAADRLRHCVGDRGMLSRVGGDEFAVLLSGENARAKAETLASEIVLAMNAPFAANHINMVVSASVGVACGVPQDSVDDLCRLADVAMYAAKGSGKNRWRAYDPEMDEGRETRKLLESELRDSLARDELDVVFQPIVDAASGKIICVEALARWISPTQGPIGPAIFIPIAEESGLIVQLGEAILRKACVAAHDWPVNIAVNLSPAQFWHQGLAADIARVLRECDFPAERLELEITEGYLLSRPEMAVEVITALRAQGIRLALDDFGTGFASIGYLRRFALDRIKLDRSFVETVDRDSEAMMVAQAVIALSHALKLPITAEGVETLPQAQLLKLAGCERLQGWYYGHPGQPADIGALFTDERCTDEPRRATPR
jgi:diguanylate cyclase (GGDEF)-like protein